MNPRSAFFCFLSLVLVSGRKGRPGILFFVLIFSAVGCSSDSQPGASSQREGAVNLPDPQLWDAPDMEPPRARFVDLMPQLADVSSWAGQIPNEQGQIQKPAGLPYLGLGNGSIFCLLGTTNPLDTIHGLFGPTYQNHDLWLTFPDIRWTLKVSEKAVSFQEQAIWRVRRTAVILTRARAPELEMWTVTFAPFPASWPGRPAPENQILFRLVYLRNLTSSGLKDLTLGVRLPGSWGRVSDGTLTSVSGERMLRIVPLDRAGEQAERSLILPVSLQPGEESGLAYALVTSSPSFSEEPALESLSALTLPGVEGKLLDVIQAWRAWYGEGTHLDTPDPRVNDLMEGLAVTDKVQTTIYGGPVEMSHYSLVWNRDTYGPVRMFTATGRGTEARGVLDYHFAAVRYRGGLANAYDADLDPAAAPPAPSAEQWDAMGTFSGRTAAEGPSFLVLDYDRYLLMQGDFSDFESQDLASRLDMLRACVYQQALSEDGLLPFSGDETFRPQMAISFGLGIEYPFQDEAWSFSSGVLLVAAAEALARIEEAAAPVLGTDGTEVAQRARDYAERVRQSTREHYWNAEQGYFEPFLLKPENEPAGAPYGDVDAVPFWVDVDFPAADPEEVADVLVRRLFSRQHVFFSPADPLLRCLLGAVIGEGIYTGMTPGYTLWTLASVFHPSAQDAFNAFDNHADPGGNYPEVVIHDDTSPLMPLYDNSGLTGEMWARYRSWEGGLNAEAMLYFLSGFLADATRNRILLAPRLPNNWPYLHITGLAIGPSRLDLHVNRTGLSRMQVSLLLQSETPLTALVRIPGPPLASASLNGLPVGPGTRIGQIWGGTASDLGEFALEPGENMLLVEFTEDIS